MHGGVHACPTSVRFIWENRAVVAGGFHSPMERECLDYLLRGQQAVVLSPAFGIDWLQPGEVERRALKEDRLMVVSIAGSEVTKATRESALLRNTFVAALADAVFVPHAVPGGQAELMARQAIARGQVVMTFDDQENAHLIDSGARPFRI